MVEVITQREIDDLLKQGAREWKEETTFNLLKAMDQAPKIGRDHFTASPDKIGRYKKTTRTRRRDLLTDNRLEIARYQGDESILEDLHVRRALRKTAGNIPTHLTYGLMSLSRR